MRLAITHAYSWPEVRRGAERIIYELSRALAWLGHDVTVFTAGAAGSRETSDGVTTVRMRRLFRSDAHHEAHFGAWLVVKLARSRFDAVHAHGPQDARAAIRAARIRPHRTIYTNLGLPIRSFWNQHPASRAHSRVVADVDVYGCMSRYALDRLPSEYGREGTLSPGGVNTESFVPSPEREAAPTILFSAALGESRKGGAVLMRAFEIVLQTEPAARLWLSGPGDAEPLLASVAVEVRDHIEVLGIGDPKGQARRYGRAWVTALPSKSDSFGLVVIESLACGTPVAASNHAALPELVDAGVTGMICDPDDAVSVANALLDAFALARRRGTVEACRASAERYDWKQSIAPLYERIYAGTRSIGSI